MKEKTQNTDQAVTSPLWQALRCYVPFRERHVFTRKGGLRLRYLALPALAAAAVVTIAGFSQKTEAYYRDAPAATAVFAQADNGGADLDDSAAASALALAAVQPTAAAVELPRIETVIIAKGGTLSGALEKAGLSRAESYRMVEAMKDLYDPRKVQAGQALTLRYDPTGQAGEGSGGDGYEFSFLRMALDPLRTLVVSSDETGALAAAIEDTPVEKRVYANKAQIEVSLYGSAAKAGIPAGTISEAIRIYSWDVDFQRDIRQGDSIEVLYEQIEKPDGQRIKSGDILYARLTVNGHDIPIYRYEDEHGDVDYYTPDGRSIRKALMKTPVDGARISSGFGMRKHPVLGYSKMHKGLDFAAPRGTPIYAAGDGVIEKAGPFSSFGNYVRIRHNSNLKTAYAHMKYIQKGIKVGTRVKQGQVIGAVGTTGRSTGPHLHYEIHVAGKQVNPQTYKSDKGEALKGAQLAAFKGYIGQVDQQYAALSGDLKYAATAEDDRSATTLR